MDQAALAGRTIDTLNEAELEVVCEQERARLGEHCLESTLNTATSREQCESTVAACRDRMTPMFPRPCTATFVADQSCPITVSDYVTCLDDWRAGATCNSAGYGISPPESCQAIIARCEFLASLFVIERTLPFPCTAEESSGKPPDTNDDIYGHDGCRPPVARFVALGDSIADCVGTTTRDNCAPYLIADYLRESAAPNLAFEMHAVAGAVVADLPGQAQQVAGGPGHVFVWTYAIGNDLFGGADFVGWEAAFNELFDYFTDTTRFPDGATFLLNTQYTNDDECGQFTPDFNAFIVEVNQRLFIDVAEARDDAVAIDHYPDFLGHGENADVTGCPHCDLDNTRWLDGAATHPNDIGHAHIAEKWYLALEGMISGVCGSPAPSDGRPG